MHYCTMTECIFASSVHGMQHWTKTYIEHVQAKTGLTLTGLAGKAKISSTTLTRAMNSAEHKFDLSRRTLDKVQAATGISYAQFAPGVTQAIAQEMNGDEIEVHSEPSLIDVYDVHASAGHGAVVAAEEIIERLAFPRDYLGRITKTGPANLAIIGVKGDSMEPTLKDDDVVMLDLTKTNLDYDGLFVLRWGDALHVKRIGRGTNGSVKIISDNSTIYPPIDIDREEVTVVGKVIWKGQKV